VPVRGPCVLRPPNYPNLAKTCCAGRSAVAAAAVVAAAERDANGYLVPVRESRVQRRDKVTMECDDPMNRDLMEDLKDRDGANGTDDGRRDDHRGGRLHRHRRATGDERTVKKRSAKGAKG